MARAGVYRLKPEPGADQSAAQHLLQISVVGGISVAYRGREIRIKSRKSRALIAYLALNEPPQESRERLVGLFWSESDEHKARASLRQTLRDLRQCFLAADFHGLQTEKLDVVLEAGSIEVDLWAAIREAESQRVHPVVINSPRLAERLLEGFDDIDPEFRVWLLAKRQTLQDRLLRALEDGLRSQVDDHHVRAQFAEALLQLDPTHEGACRSLMRTRAEEGDVSGALRAYKALWDMLDDEYGMEPSAKTQDLVAQIKIGNIERKPAAAPGTAVGIPSGAIERKATGAAAKPAARIALLVKSFGINGIADDKMHLVHGFRHHLIACLIRFREWYVSDNVNRPLPQGHSPAISAEYEIEATGYQAGDSLSLVLTLRDSRTNLYVWSETFELKLESWFTIQQRIVRRIAASLNVQLSAERLNRLASEPDVSLEVYDRWLRGQAMILRFSPENWKRSAQIFSDAIAEAPNFSPCYSSLVQMNNGVHIVHPGVFRHPALERQTLDLARTAVRLDAIDSRAQLCLGWSYAMMKQYAQAEVHMDLACELNENDPWTLISTALFHAFCAKFDRARDLARQALEVTLAPSPTHWAYLVSIRFMCGDYLGTVEAANQVADVIKTPPAWKAAALFHLGRRDEAILEARQFLNEIRSSWFGAGAPTDEAIGRWLLHLYPISHRQHWERLRDGIVGAGIPIVDIDHHAW